MSTSVRRRQLTRLSVVSRSRRSTSARWPTKSTIYWNCVVIVLSTCYALPKRGILQTPCLDPTDPRSYRPISNLPVSSKLLERLVARQLLACLNTSGLLPRLQSAYRPHHSTETAIPYQKNTMVNHINKPWFFGYG